MEQRPYPRVVVTGLGALTPIGLSPSTFWDGMMQGMSGAGPITRYDATDHRTRIACELKGFDPKDYLDYKQARRWDPFCQYAVASARQAVEDANLDLEALSAEEKDRIGVIYGSGIGGIGLMEQQARVLMEEGPSRISPFLGAMMIINMAPGLIAMEFGLRGPNHSVVSACATGNHAIGEGLTLLRTGRADAVLVGGSEAPLSPLCIGGFEAMRALSTRNDDPKTASRPFDADRDGFVPGEGAGALVLETLERAQARGARIYCELLGFGSSADAYHISAPDPEGRGVYLAMTRAFADAGIETADVDYINMHATSTPLGDVAETQAIKKVFGDDAYQMKCSSTKSMTGHLLGAAGAVEAVAAILAMQQNRVPPTINVETLDPKCDLDYTLGEPADYEVDIACSNAFGFGGHNTTAVFGRLKD